jgi:HK97 gp10 family phage protein
MVLEIKRVEGLSAVLKTLNELGPAASKGGGPVRAVLRKAAVLMQKEVKENLQRIILEPNEGGLPNRSTGLLADNIVITRSAPRGFKGERMLVRVRRKAYPERISKKLAVTSQVARLLEGGTSRMRPHPFIRPAFDAKKNEALALFATELPRAVLRLQKKIARANGAK